MSRKKVLFTQLVGCNGCLMAVLGTKIFIDLMETVQVDFFPFLCDNKSEKYDFAFIEGSGENCEEELYELRSLSETIVALGTCATLGGVSNLYPKHRSVPLRKIVPIDYEIPGCPPPPSLLGRAIMNIITGKEYELDDRVLCFECKFKRDSTVLPRIKSLIPQTPPQKCFIEEGVLCMGPITRMGCEAACISSNVPCEGCMGSPYNGISPIVNMLSVLPMSNELRDYRGNFYRFTENPGT